MADDIRAWAQGFLSPHGLALAEDAIRGRHIVATRAFKAGELVLSQEPYAAVLHDTQVPVRCDYCYALKEELSTCGRSQFARYCSRAHQKGAWSSGYKEECAAHTCIPKKDRRPTATMRLLARAAWRAAREAKQASDQSSSITPANNTAAHTWPAPSGSWDIANQLVDHWDTLTTQQQVTYTQVAAAARDFAVAGLHPGSVPPSAFSQFTGHANHSTPNNPTNNPTDSLTNNDHAGNQTNGHSSNNHPTSASANGQIAPSDTSPTESDGLPSLRALTHLLSRLVFNSHTICDAELRPVGMGLYPLASMANHSDQPSCLQSFIGSTICFRALRDIRVGDEVTISYIDLGMTRQQRREVLWDQYHFDTAATSPHTPQHTSTDTAVAPPPPQADPTPQTATSTPSRQSQATVTAPVGGQQGVGVAVGGTESGAGGAAGVRSACWRAADVALRPVPHADIALTYTPDTSVPPVSSSLGHASVPIRLRVYGSNGSDTKGVPHPWPVDTCDGEFTAVEVVLGGGVRKVMVGGVQGVLVHTQQSLEDQLFSGLLIEDRDDEPGVDAPEASATQAPQQQAALQCHIEAWGAWTGLHTSSHLPSASDASSAASVASQVPALAHHLAGLLLTVHEAEAQRKAGEHKRSLALLQGALKKADSMSVAWTDKGQTTGGPGGGGAAQVIVRLGDCQLLRKQILDGMQQAAIESGSEWSDALQVARLLAPVYDKLYDRTSPTRGLHYAALSKLENLVGSLEAAKAAAETALEVLAVTHGTGAWGQEGAAVCQEVARIRWEAMQEMQR